MKRRSLLAAASALALSGGCLFDEDFGASDERLDATGTIEIEIDGAPVDLTEDRFQAEHADDHSLAFHLHEGDDHWYMEGERPVTFAEAIDLLPHFAYAQERGDHVVTVDGTTYDERDPGTDVAFAVDGDEVAPTEYELRDGDHLFVEIRTDAEGASNVRTRS